MRLFSDFRLFEKPPKPGFNLIRWIAWRWLFLGVLFIIFVSVFALAHYVGGEPIYYTNEDRYLTDGEARDTFEMFFGAGGLFLILGLLGVMFTPKS